MKPSLRCAVYTRKSSEEGLDQDYNSLHAQRDACEAYVRSQAGEGWALLPEQYDDGGISGGTMERPALRTLLADIAQGRIDIVVVYKVDRLTRSLGDFARIVEVFDRHGVSFVSVTQAFNTTSSMGRLTLNVLLSFAQFEREVTGERIRDKIAASKQKGMWMGGLTPLGYDADGRTLKINPTEAELVRLIFRRYVVLKSVHRLKDELDAAGHRSKLRVFQSGRSAGGACFARGALFHLLANRAYLGEVPHGKISYPGLHPPIIDNRLFDEAAAVLAENRRRHETKKATGSRALLAGRIFDQAGQPMSPTAVTARHARRYRYYVSAPLQQGQRADQAASLRRLPAPPLEGLIENILKRLTPEDGLAALQRLDVRDEGMTLTLGLPRSRLALVRQRSLEAEDVHLTEDGAIAVDIPTRLVFRGGRCWLITPPGIQYGARIAPDRGLIAALKRAHAIAKAHRLSPLEPPSSVVRAVGVADPYERKLVRLAFLPPHLQRSILLGTQPRDLRLQHLIDDEQPAVWALG